MTKPHTFTSVVIKNVAFVLTLFFVFLLFSAIFSSFFKPKFESVSIDQLPPHFPLAVTWKNRTGTSLCRIILQQQKEELLSKIPSLSFNASEQDMGACDYALDYLKHKNKWPYILKSDKNVNNVASIDYKEQQDTGHFEVNYSESRDSHNSARYSVSNNQIASAEYKHYIKNQYTFTATPYSLLATLALWLFYSLYKKFLKIRIKIKQ